MKTIVKNVLTNDKMFFVNDLSLVDNMVNAIIYIEKKSSNLLNEDLRNNIVKEFNLVERISKNGDLICFCEKLDLFARQQSNKQQTK